MEITEAVYGDGRLSHCINRFTSAEFTVLPTFHQVDLQGDISGLLQGPLEFATLYNIMPDANSIYPKWHPIGLESIESNYTLQLDLFHLSRKILGSDNWGI